MLVLIKGAEATAGSMPMRFNARGTKVPTKADKNILQSSVMATRILRARLLSQIYETRQSTTEQPAPTIKPTMDSLKTFIKIFEASTCPVEIPRTVTVEL